MLRLFLFVFSCLVTQIICEDAYIQMSSVAIQIPTPVTGSLVTADTIDLIKNFEVSPARDAVICKVPGLYYVCSGIQPATLIRGISGYIDAWFVLNGEAISFSNSRQFIDENSRVTLMTNTILIQLEENDILATGFKASGPEIGLIFIQSPLRGEPSVTSFLFSAYKIR